MRSTQQHTRKTVFKTAITTVLRRGRKTASKRRILSVNSVFSAAQNLAIGVNQSASPSSRVQNTAQPLTALPRRSS